MSTRRKITQADLPRDWTIETYDDGTAWIVWANGNRRQRLCDYAALVAQACRTEDCGTLPGDPCMGTTGRMCAGRPGDGDHRYFQSAASPPRAEPT